MKCDFYTLLAVFLLMACAEFKSKISPDIVAYCCNSGFAV